MSMRPSGDRRPGMPGVVGERTVRLSADGASTTVYCLTQHNVEIVSITGTDVYQ